MAINADGYCIGPAFTAKGYDGSWTAGQIIATGECVVPAFTAFGETLGSIAAHFGDGAAIMPAFEAGGTATRMILATGGCVAPAFLAGGTSFYTMLVDGTATMPVFLAEGLATVELMLSGEAVMPVFMAGGDIQSTTSGYPILQYQEHSENWAWQN